jgi:MerR family transcriptional regulator, light-induced transcriptional regulator
VRTDRDSLAYNLKAVVTATGLTPDTLRAWERRYGVPHPQRTAGGHRLYSQRDIDMLRWLIARQHEGVSISRAADLWNQLTEQGRDPLGVQLPTSAPLLVAGSVGLLRQEWETACLAFDEPAAESVLSRAYALHPPEIVCLEVLQAGLADIGDRWYQGEVSVQQEHFAVQLAQRRLERLMAAAPVALRPGRILIACAPAEFHTFGSLLFALMLRWRGWSTLFLGANVPLERIDVTVVDTRPNLVVLSAQRLHTAATLLGAARLIADLGFTVAFGGRIFSLSPSLRPRVAGFFLGEGLLEAVATAERLAESMPPTPKGEPVPERFARALEQYRDRQTLIEIEVGRATRGGHLSRAELGIANDNLAESIEAGLALGDLGALGPDLDWLGGLLANRHRSANALRDYFAAYHRAAAATLDDRGAPIVEWLSRLSAREWVEGAADVATSTRDAKSSHPGT